MNQPEGGLSRCEAEIAAIEAAIRAGVEPLEDVLLGLHDWSTERRLILAEL